MNLKSIFSFSRALLLISSLLHVEFANSTSYEYFTESSGAYVVNQVCYKISGGNAYVTYSGLSKYYWYYDGHKYGPDFDGYVGGYLGTSADVTIPSSVTISSSTYNVTSIGEYAFEEENFTSVNLPDGIMTIGKKAFNYCENLTSINFPSSLKTIGSDAFAYCNKLTSAVIPSGVTNIDSRAFYGCSSLILLSLPNSITSIEESVFAGCSSLPSVTIPNSVMSIGNSAFSGCSSLASLIIPSSVTTIGSYSFYGCSSLASLTIPSSVTTIGNSAFSGCTGLLSLTVIEDNPIYDSRNNCNAIIETASNTLIKGCKNTIIPDGIISIGSGSFAGVSDIISVIIPNSVISIENSAFKNCTGLTSMTIPSGVTSLGNYSFEGCSGLTTVSIPSTVTTIGDYSFKGCSGLTSLTIPSGVKSIGYESFSDCNSLTSVIIPPSVTSISSYAFYGCDNLTSVYMNCFVPLSIGSTTFSNRSNATLYVPMGTKEAYESADYWKDFKEIIEVGGIIAADDFAACPGGLGSTLSINMKNVDDIVGFQFDLQLPEGVSLTIGTNGKYLANLTSRKVDHTLYVNKVGENTYRFISVSMNNEAFEGTEGTLLKMTVKVDDNVAFGNYDIKVLNAELTTSNLESVKSMDETSVLTVKNADPGDANGDGDVNVTDIVEIVNYIMEKPSDRFIAAAADLNGDGEISVTDIVKVVSIIMSAGTNASRRVSAMEMIDNDQLTMAVDNDGVYSLHLSNEAQYVASQFEIRLGDGQTLEGVRLNGKRSDGHLMSYTQTGNNLYKVIVFSTENRPFSGNSGEFVSFKVSGNGSVEVSNILFVTSGEAEKTFPSLHAGTTGIDVTKISDTIDVYSIDGRMVRRQVTSTNDLEKGLYIIKGKKVIVK